MNVVRSVSGVEWALPQLRANGAVRTRQGDLKQVEIIGMDDATLIRLPKNFLRGERSDLSIPDTVITDDVGAAGKFPGLNPAGERLSLVIAGTEPRVSPEELVQRIEVQTGLQARTREARS